MKHVSEKWLRKLNLVYQVYAGLLIVAYLVGRFVPMADFLLPYMGKSIVTPIAAAISLIYGLVVLRYVRDKNVWTAYFISYFLVLLMSFLPIDITGDYTSHFFGIITVVAFLGGMVGYYAPLLTVGMLFLAAVLTMLGSIESQSSNSRMAVTILIVTSASALGWLFWRLFYEKVKSDTAQLAGMLKKEQLKSEIILNSMRDGVVVVDATGTIQYMNPSAASIIGWERQDAITLKYESVLKLCGQDHKAYTEAQDPFKLARNQKGQIRDNNAVLETKSGKFVSISIDASALLDAQGVDTGNIIGVFRDVSKERGEEARRAEFISTASHEMRTPVAAIEGYLALALNEKVSKIDTKARSYLEKAHSSTQHLGKLFQDLLTSAKAEDGRLTSHPTAVELGDFLQKLTDDLKFSAEKKGLFMEFVIGGNETTIDASGGGNVAGGKIIRPLYYAYVDGDRLREVITNLFDNAVKYTDTGKISIGLTGNNEVVQFYVRDTGPGIPAEDVPHLFQKFYRVDNSTTRTTGGTGLGLFICRKIIELYNGRVWVESEVGKGSTFYLNLPRLTNQKVEEYKAQEAAASQTVPQLSSNSQTL